ncbi:MAG: SAM-dependent methyltransferase [Bacteroidales bacterium]|nr:SAM-dependent methyltransferase [Bacteroidales bacterium]MDY0216626.1 SAM-dependent methyltransferase [Bacteroidales bacterium]
MIEKIQEFIEIIQQNILLKNFVKLTISDKKDKTDEVKSIIIKHIEIKKGEQMSFVYRYQTKDITKNFAPEEALELISELLLKDYNQANLSTTEFDYHFWTRGKKSGIKTKKTDKIVQVQLFHDKLKNRIIEPENNFYLQKLGVTNSLWQIKPNMQDKYKQINKYIEIVDGILKDYPFKQSVSIVDMGSGKGYLTFALYDYFANYLQKKAMITGVEMRANLVEQSNEIAKMCNFKNLHFIEGSIQEAKTPDYNVLIALHACDTATDDAIAQGIKNNAEVIICAPCCHKQLRPQIKPDNILREITKFGILLERQSEMLTDTIRGLMLEAHGYKTNIFEFIETIHTPKNVMIVATKRQKPLQNKAYYLEQIQELKNLFGIENHYLENLLK